MKFNSFFLLIISLATVPFLVNTHPASARPPAPRIPCSGSKCTVILINGSTSGGTTDPEVSQRLKALLAQGDLAGAERTLLQFIGQAERAQDLNGQAAAHQALGDLYMRMRKPDLASSHLKNADTLYQGLGNSQGSSEVRVQLRQTQLQQIQLQQIQLQQR